MLATKVEYDSPVDEGRYQRMRDAAARLRREFPEPRYQWLDFNSTYERKLGDQSFATVAKFAQDFPGLIMPLLGERHVGLVTMIDWDTSDAETVRLIHALQDAPEFKDGHVYLGGLPYINLKLNQFSEDIKLKLIPLMFGVCFLLTAWILRDPRRAALLMVPCVFGLIATMAMIKALYGSLNMVTAVVPLRIFVINLTLCFHLYFMTMSTGDMASAFRQKWQPLTFAIIATAIGFGSNAVSAIPVVQQLAWVALLMVIITATSSALGLWLMEPWLQPSGVKITTRLHDARILRLFDKGLSRRAIAVVAVLILCGAAFLLPRLFILTDATRYFPPSSGIKEALTRVETGFLGTPTFEVVVSRGDGQDFTFEDDQKMALAEGDVMRSFDGTYKILSLAALGREANRMFSGNAEIPANRMAWTLLLGGLPENVRASFPQGPAYRMSLLGTSINYYEFKDHLSKLQGIFASLAPTYKFEINGLNYNLMQAQSALIDVLSLSFLGSLAVITVMFAFFFRDVRSVGIFLLVNLLPVSCGVLAIWLLGFSLNIATVMAFGIALGMIVGNSVHVLWELKKLKQGKSWAAIARETLLSIGASGMVLVVGFGLFGLNGFLPIRQEGLVVAAMIVAGILSALFILPTLVLGRSRFHD